MPIVKLSNDLTSSKLTRLSEETLIKFKIGDGYRPKRIIRNARGNKIIFSLALKSFKSSIVSLVIVPKTTLLYRNKPYTADKITPVAAKIAATFETLNAAITVKNSPTKPLFPGNATFAIVKIIKKIAKFGIIDTRRP